jgi:toxin-antitoxin system PIN domain toxin
VIVPDVNLLIYAYNDASPFHQAAAAWWEACLSGSEPVGLTYPVLFAFVRITTGIQAYPNPLTLQQSKECVEEWMTCAATHILTATHNHFDQVFELLESAGSAGGNLVVDAQIAAIAISHKATVHTADRDFMRFRGLNCFFPLDEPVRN